MDVLETGSWTEGVTKISNTPKSLHITKSAFIHLIIIYLIDQKDEE
jgi:hypothetical protein